MLLKRESLRSRDFGSDLCSSGVLLALRLWPYAQLYEKKQELLPFLIGCFGLLCSLVWTLQNRGSKCWQEAWEQKVYVVEKSVLGTDLFSNWEPVQSKGIWGAAKFSVSRLAIALSDCSVLVWIVLSVKAAPDLQFCTPQANWTLLVALVTVGYIVAFFVWGRTSDAAN